MAPLTVQQQFGETENNYTTAAQTARNGLLHTAPQAYMRVTFEIFCTVQGRTVHNGKGILGNGTNSLKFRNAQKFQLHKPKFYNLLRT